MSGLHIIATGRCLPKNAVTNDKLSETVDTNDEWIRSRTGIQQRYYCSDDEDNTFLATGAGRQALERSGIAKEDLGAVVVATLTGDYATPSTACLVQRNLGLPTDIPVLDVNAACTGFLYGLQVAKGLLMQSDKKYALVVGSEDLSRLMDFEDRSVCVLFGDGAAAAVVELSDEHPYHCVLGAEGDADILYCRGAGSHDEKGMQAVRMQGQEVFRFAVRVIPKCANRLLEISGLTMADINYIVCHQANERIIRSAIKKMKEPEEKFYINLHKYGNTSSASIPIALDEMVTDGIIQPGMKVMCIGFGAGLTWGGAILDF
jgi:3-oxoacyl-[acyl-carrier-protein] synthase-3